MESLSELLLQEKMLCINIQNANSTLNGIRQKIQLLKEFEEQTTVTNVPGQFTDKTKAIPEQTAPGKESTNPLMAVALPKSIRKDIDSPSGFPTNLFIPNTMGNGIHKVITSPSEASTSKLVAPDTLGKSIAPKGMSSSSFGRSPPDSFMSALLAESNLQKNNFYVIFDGPQKGIFTEWPLVKKLVTGFNYAHKRYSSLSLAQKAASSFDPTIDLCPNALVPKLAPLRPIRTPFVLKAKEEKPVIIDHFSGVSFESFLTLWNKARNSNFDSLASEYYFTSDKKMKSSFNFVENADPELVYSAFTLSWIGIIPTYAVVKLVPCSSPC